MQDEEIDLLNACTDLVSLESREAFPSHLLRDKASGEWVVVREFCLQVGLVPGDFKPHVFATWLADPLAQAAYVMILFYDDDSKWSMVAHYNRLRLLGEEPSNQTAQAATNNPAQ